MLKTLRSLIGVHQKGDATAAEIEAALAGARDEISAAERAHAGAEAAYRAGLLRLDEGALQQLIADKDTAAVRRDRATALVEALAARLADAQATEEQARRRQHYDDAARVQAATAKVLAAEYPKLARALVGLLRKVAEADDLAAVANRELPEGVERLATVESRVRREANVPARVLGDETFTAWCRTGGTRLAPEDAAMVKADAGGRTGIWKPIGCEPVPVILRRFRRLTTRPEAAGRDIASLASSLNLPALRAAHIPFWKAGAADSPAAIVAAIAAAAPSWGETIGSTVLHEPEPRIEVIPLDEPDARAAA